MTIRKNDKTVPEVAVNLSFFFSAYKNTRTIIAISIVLINEYMPYLVFSRKRGRTENTSLIGVSVIKEQCRIICVILEISEMIEIINMTGTDASPIVLLLPVWKQASAPEGTVINCLEMRAPAIKAMLERKSQYAPIIRILMEDIYFRVNL